MTQVVPWSRYSGPATSLHAHVHQRGSLPTLIHEELTVLQNVTNDTEFVEITTTTFCAKGLLETDLDIADGMFVPSSSHSDVGETEDQQVLDHLLAEVVVNAVSLLLFP